MSQSRYNMILSGLEFANHRKLNRQKRDSPYRRKQNTRFCRYSNRNRWANIKEYKRKGSKFPTEKFRRSDFAKLRKASRVLKRFTKKMVVVYKHHQRDIKTNNLSEKMERFIGDNWTRRVKISSSKTVNLPSERVVDNTIK